MKGLEIRFSKGGMKKAHYASAEAVIDKCILS
jgi:hypothetical protein